MPQEKPEPSFVVTKREEFSKYRVVRPTVNIKLDIPIASVNKKTRTVKPRTDSCLGYIFDSIRTLMINPEIKLGKPIYPEYHEPVIIRTSTEREHSSSQLSDVFVSWVLLPLILLDPKLYSVSFISDEVKTVDTRYGSWNVFKVPAFTSWSPSVLWLACALCRTVETVCHLPIVRSYLLKAAPPSDIITAIYFGDYSRLLELWCNIRPLLRTIAATGSPENDAWYGEGIINRVSSITEFQKIVLRGGYLRCGVSNNMADNWFLRYNALRYDGHFGTMPAWETFFLRVIQAQPSSFDEQLSFQSMQTPTFGPKSEPVIHQAFDKLMETTEYAELLTTSG